MPRPKKRYPEREKALEAARAYLRQQIPELSDMPLHLHVLDVVPGAPRYAVTAEQCQATSCPHGIELVVAQSGDCPIMTCRLRHSVKLLLNEQGEVIHETRGDVHWG